MATALRVNAVPPNTSRAICSQVRRPCGMPGSRAMAVDLPYAKRPGPTGQRLSSTSRERLHQARGDHAPLARLRRAASPGPPTAHRTEKPCQPRCFGAMLFGHIGCASQEACQPDRPRFKIRRRRVPVFARADVAAVATIGIAQPPSFHQFCARYLRYAQSRASYKCTKPPRFSKRTGVTSDSRCLSGKPPCRAQIIFNKSMLEWVMCDKRKRPSKHIVNKAKNEAKLYLSNDAILAHCIRFPACRTPHPLRPTFITPFLRCNMEVPVL